MARRTDHTPEQQRAMALAAARDIIAAEGLAALAARRVAREIGYSAGAIYNLFADLNDLLDHVNAATLDEIAAACAGAAAEARPEVRVRALAAAYLDFALTHPGLYGALFARRQGGDGRPPDWYAAKVTALLAPLEAALSARVGPKAAEGEALALWAAIHGVVSLEIADKLGSSGRAPELAECILGHWLGRT